MKVISRYILKKCMFNTITLLFALAMIYTVINAISEIGNIGKGRYTMVAMFIYLFSQLPSYIYLLVPLAVLIGVMTAMLGLVKNSEYAIIRTSGVSLSRITSILFIFGLIFMIFTFLIGEIISPTASHFAKVYKMNKMNAQISTELSSGIWSKDGEHNIINIKQIDQNDGAVIKGVQIFSYNEDQQLTHYITALYGEYNHAMHSWNLYKPSIYSYNYKQIEISRLESYTWKSSIDPSYFNVLVIAPEDMPVFSLTQYIRHLRSNNQSVSRYEIAFWSKLLYPISCISMALIAIGFIPNNGRNINLSSKLFLGILIGVTFFFSNKLIGFIALLYNWNAILSSSIPTVLLLLISWWIITHKESR